MTNNTITNVTRELLADLLCDDHDRRIMAERHLLAMLANAPSPAGVDGLACAEALLLPALRQYMHNDGTGLLAGYDLETTETIIDGLRGEVDYWKRMFNQSEKALDRVNALRSRDGAKQARGIQNIGYALDLIGGIRHGENVTPNELWRACEHLDAALSAGKEGE